MVFLVTVLCKLFASVYGKPASGAVLTTSRYKFTAQAIQDLTVVCTQTCAFISFPHIANFKVSSGVILITCYRYSVARYHLSQKDVWRSLEWESVYRFAGQPLLLTGILTHLGPPYLLNRALT